MAASAQGCANSPVPSNDANAESMHRLSFNAFGRLIKVLASGQFVVQFVVSAQVLLQPINRAPE